MCWNIIQNCFISDPTWNSVTGWPWLKESTTKPSQRSSSTTPMRRRAIGTGTRPGTRGRWWTTKLCFITRTSTQPSTLNNSRNLRLPLQTWRLWVYEDLFWIYFQGFVISASQSCARKGFSLIGACSVSNHWNIKDSMSLNHDSRNWFVGSIIKCISSYKWKFYFSDVTF